MIHVWNVPQCRPSPPEQFRDRSKPLLVDNDIVNTDGKPKFGFHALCHAAASLFIEQGWPAKKVQSILGHSSITMMMDVYGRLFESPEDDVEMFEKIEADLMAA